jgi:peptidoglycan hydrolase CwlO-like protein
LATATTTNHMGGFTPPFKNHLTIRNRIMTDINLKSVSKVITIGASIVCALGVISGIKNEGVTRNIALTVAVSSAVLGGINRSLTGSYEDSANFQARNIIEPIEEKSKKLTRQNNELDRNVKSLSEILDTTKRELELVNVDKESLNFQLRLINGKLADIEKDYQAKNRSLDEQLSTEDTRVQDFLDAFKSQLINDCAVRVDNVYSSLQAAVSSRLENDEYSKLRDKLVEFLNVLNASYTKHSNQLFQLAELDTQNIELFVNETIGTYTDISSQMASLKVRFRNLLNVDERLQLDDAYMLLADFKDSAIPKTAAQSLLREQSEVAKNKLSKLDEIALDAQNGLDEMRSQVFDLIGQIENKNLRVLELENEIKRLNQPLSWRLATSRELQIGNLIIAYFWQKGFYLDRSHSKGDAYEVKLFFQIDRNERAILAKELNEHSEQLQQYCRCLHPISFDFDGDIGLMVATVQLKTREKSKMSVDEIYRLITPHTRFGETLRRYHDHKKSGLPTLRVMTRTGGGKQIAVKNLIQSYVNNENFEIWLSDPQHGSDQDFWDIPKIGTDTTTAVDALNSFVDEFSARKEKRSTNPKLSILGIFDECDKTYDRTEKQKISKIWTEIRHHNMRLILIGQSGEVGKNGWTWDEMNNCTMLFIGDAIGTAIKHANDLNTVAQNLETIEKTYKTVSAWMREANQDIPVENQYRLALIVSGGKYEFIEIPPALKGEIENNRSTIVSKKFESLSLNTQNQTILNNSEGWIDESKKAFIVPHIECPKCQSIEFTRHRKRADVTTHGYMCKQCKNEFTSYNNKSPNIN